MCVAMYVCMSHPDTSTALALKWEGTTQSVRAFTCTPSTSVVTPRSIYFTRQADDESVKIFATDPLYPVLMWPLAFPKGQPLATAAGEPLGVTSSDEYSKLFSINQGKRAVAADASAACAAHGRVRCVRRRDGRRLIVVASAQRIERCSPIYMWLLFVVSLVSSRLFFGASADALKLYHG